MNRMILRAKADASNHEHLNNASKQPNLYAEIRMVHTTIFLFMYMIR